MKTPENCYCSDKKIGMCVPCAIQSRIVAGESFLNVIFDFPVGFKYHYHTKAIRVKELEAALAEIRDEWHTHEEGDDYEEFCREAAFKMYAIALVALK